MTASPLPDQVSVLILGGTTHLSRPLLKWLLDPSHDADRANVEIKHVRLADKHLVSGGTSTTYIEPDTFRALQDPRVEYRQANLNLASTLEQIYSHPQGGSYDVVFDFTGEGIRQPDLPEELLKERTAKLARSIATMSLKHHVKAHIRDTFAFMTVAVGAPPAKESDPVKPNTARAYWWYEAERAAASVPHLPLAIIRSAEVVGPYLVHGTVPVRYAFGKAYQHLNEPMKLLWGPQLRIHTIHVDDWCCAAWKLVQWVACHSRHEANQLAGEDLAPVRINDKMQEAMREKADPDCCARSQTPRAPVFNLVDDTDLDQGKLLKMIGEAFRIQTGFVNALVNAYARLNINGVVDEINEKHARAIGEIVQQSGIDDVALNGWLDPELLANRSLALDNAKAKRILHWTPTIEINRHSLDQILDKLRELNQFPQRDSV